MELEQTVRVIDKVLRTSKLSLQNEKMLQAELFECLTRPSLQPIREYRLDDKNIVDFYIDGVGLEVKIKGSRKAFYKQCERYCQFDEIKALILLTNRAMGFPSEINKKPCFVINLGQAWL